MDALLTTIVLWLSANFGFSVNLDHPRIELVPQSRIVAIYYRDPARHQGAAVASQEENKTERDIVSIYDSTTRTIYLRHDWSGKTPSDLSVLVHEMVHYLQDREKQKFECPQERERLAFKAQDEWLKLFTTDLEREFQIDPFTRLVVTRCIH